MMQSGINNTPVINSRISSITAKKTVQQVAFTGASPVKLSQGVFEKGVERFFKSGFAEKLTNVSADKVAKHLPVAVSAFLSSLYVLNTVRNKQIEKERKPALIANMSLVFGISTAGGYIVNKAVNEKLDDFVKRLETAIKNFNKKHADNLINEKLLKAGVKAAVPIMVFQTMYRYIGPVIATPLADKVVKLFPGNDKKA